MNFIESIKTCFQKYAVFKGRAMRSEFWWFQSYLFITIYGAMALDSLLWGDVFVFNGVATPLAVIFVLINIVPSASVAARRLHDIGWSGWVQLPVFLTYTAYLEIWFPDFSDTRFGVILMSVGMVSWLGFLIILIKGGKAHTNKYGPNPKSPDMGTVFN